MAKRPGNKHPARRRSGPPAADVPGRVSRTPVAVLLSLVGASVGLQLVNVALVKLASAKPTPTLFVLAGLLAAVVLLSFVRFFMWNRIYRRYPLSLAYPLSAIFFPGVVLLAWLTGERVGMAQVGGAALVMAGVVWFVMPEGTAAPSPAGG